MIKNKESLSPNFPDFSGIINLNISSIIIIFLTRAGHHVMVSVNPVRTLGQYVGAAGT